MAADLTPEQQQIIEAAAAQISGLVGGLLPGGVAIGAQEGIETATQDVLKQIDAGKLSVEEGRLIVTDVGREAIEEAGGTITGTPEGGFIVSPPVREGVMFAGLPGDPTGRLSQAQWQEKLRQEELARQQAIELARQEAARAALPFGWGEPVIAEEPPPPQVTIPIIPEPVTPKLTVEEIKAMTEVFAEKEMVKEELVKIPEQIRETEQLITEQEAEIIKAKEQLEAIEGMKSDVKTTPDVTWGLPDKKEATAKEALAYLKEQETKIKKAITSMKGGVKEAEKYLKELPIHEEELKVYESKLWAAEFERLPPGEIRKAPKYEPLSVSEAVYSAIGRIAEPARELGMSPEMIATMAAMPVAALETTPILGAGISAIGKELGVISREARIGLFGAEEAPLTVGWALGLEAGPLWAQTPEAKFLGLMSEVGADIMLGKAAAVTYKAGLKVAKKVVAKVVKVKPKVLIPITTRIASGIYETSIELKKTLLRKPMEARLITRVTDVVTPETKLILSESIGVAEVPRYLGIAKKKIPIAAKAIGVAEEVTPDIIRLRALGLAGEFGVEAPFVGIAEVKKLRKPVEVLLEPLPETIRVLGKPVGVAAPKAVKLADYAQETAGFIKQVEKVEDLFKLAKVEPKPYYGLVGEYAPEAARFLEKSVLPEFIPEVVKGITSKGYSRKTKKLITDLYKREFFTKKAYDSLIKLTKKIGDLPADKVPRELGKLADKFEKLKAYDEAIKLRNLAESAKAYLAEVGAVAAVEAIRKPGIIKPFEPSIIPKPPKVVKPAVRVKEVSVIRPTRTGQLMLQRTILKEKVKVKPLVEVKVKKVIKPKVKVKLLVEELKRSKEFEKISSVSVIREKVKVEPMVKQLMKTKDLEKVSSMVKSLEGVRVDVAIKPLVKVKELELLKTSIKVKEITKIKPPTPISITPIPTIKIIPGFALMPPTPIIGGLRIEKRKRIIKKRKELKPRPEYAPSITAVYEKITTKKLMKPGIYTPMAIRPVMIKDKKKDKRKKVPVRRGIRDILKPSIKGKASKGIRDALKSSIKF